MSSFVLNFPTISGGLPTSVDLGPSILFIFLYAILLPIPIWRGIQCRRPWQLLWLYVRLLLFVTVRIITYIFRAIEAGQAKNGVVEPTLGLFEGKQILLGIGFIVLIDIVVVLVRSHLTRTDVPAGSRPIVADVEGSRFSLQNIVRLMHVAIMVALALGIVAGTEYSSALSDPSAASSLKTYRIVSSVICIVVSALCLGVSLVLLVAHSHLPQASSAYLALISCVLIIIPAYRLSNIENSTASLASLTSVATKAEFWALQATMEWIVCVLLIAVDVRSWFGAGGAEAQLSMGQGNYAPRSEMTVLPPKNTWQGA